MSKELKALERVKNFMSVNAVHWKQDIGYIETALKRLEKIENTTHSVLREDISNKLKALEIIKKYIKIYETGDDLFPYCIEENQYVSSRSCKVISKEEYELLKEVLENDKQAI